MINQILEGDSKEKLHTIESNSVDEIVTDPPYGYSFMNKDWDKSIVSVDVWKECLRVLKPGAFAYVMSAPRQDVLSHMIVNLTNAGFKTDFTSIYWAYASGFPKASNISKMVDKKGGVGMNKEFCKLLEKKRKEANLSTIQLAELGHFYGKINHGGTVSNWEKGTSIPTLEQFNKLITILDIGDYPKIEEVKREIIGQKQTGDPVNWYANQDTQERDGLVDITISKTEQAKKLDGSYAGFQPKPALEVILVCMKPLSEKNYTEQAMSNGKGVTWFDDCRIPFVSNEDKNKSKTGFSGVQYDTYIKNTDNRDITNENPTITDQTINPRGRFPANLIVSDNALDDGGNHKSGKIEDHHNHTKTNQVYSGVWKPLKGSLNTSYGDSGSFSRYFDLDKWESQFLIVEKTSKSEKNVGLELNDMQKVNDGRTIPPDNAFQRGDTDRKNTHPTVKPVTLMSYLIMMGSREGDIILDPFCGSGTTLIASLLLKRNYIGIELNHEYVNIAQKRLNYWKNKSYEKIQKIKRQVEKKNVKPLEVFF